MSVDVALGADGDLRHDNVLASGDDLTIQRVRIRLRLFLGEWLANAAEGLDFFAWIARKPTDVQGIVLKLRAEIEGTPGVASVTSLVGALDYATRALTVTGEAVLDSGAVVGIDLTPARPTFNTVITIARR